MTTCKENGVEGVTGFDKNWKSRKETLNNYWTPGTCRNQIQLAFRCHWRLFGEILGKTTGGRCLEVGCGRGSISSYFAANGFDCVLLDYSRHVLGTARDIFSRVGHRADFVCGDANGLPFASDSFDVVVSIGLLEHFDNIRTPLEEQIRVLKPGGTFLGYIVPENPGNIQKYFRWCNTILRRAAALANVHGQSAVKEAVYRNDMGSERYLPILKSLRVHGLTATGVYPMPMISHSPEFPFSLMHPTAEYGLTRVFEVVLGLRRLLFGRNPWMCSEAMGQAFLVTCRKGESLA